MILYQIRIFKVFFSDIEIQSPYIKKEILKANIFFLTFLLQIVFTRYLEITSNKTFDLKRWFFSDFDL